MSRILLVVLVLGCATLDEPVDDVGQVHASRGGTAGPQLRSEMGHHYNDLRHIGDLLRRGRLDDAKAIAYWLTRSIRDPRIREWPADAARLTTAARELAAAPTLASAVRSQARIASACGDCHARTGARAAFERDTIAPRDDSTLASRMQRHRWAADRVWDGVVGASEIQWRAGLELLAQDIAGYRVHEIATRALASKPDERAAIYGELLVGCMTCHPSNETRDKQFTRLSVRPTVLGAPATRSSSPR